MSHAPRFHLARLGACLPLTALLLLAVAPAQAQRRLQDRIEPLIQQHAGTVAVAVKHLPSGETYAYRGDEPMPTASLIKFPILIEVYQQAAEGRIDLQRKVTLRDEDKVPGSGVLTQHFSEGTELALRDAVRLMIAFSDNTATNLVIDQIGLPATNQRMQTLGCPNTQLNAKVFRRDTSLAPERSRQFGLGSTTANEMLRLWELLAAGELVSAEACQQMLEHLYACDDRTKLARYLPAGVKLAHKTGAVAQSRCDAGLIDAPGGRIVLCVLTTDNQDQSWSDDNQANLLCGRVAQAVYEHFQPAADATGANVPAELAVGAQGGLVESLQRTLNTRLDPSPDISVDGDFGPETERAVIQFQKQAGLTVDGRVDAETWKALGPLVDKGPEIPPPDVVNATQLPRDPAESLDGPPIVSCRAWGVMDVAQGEMLWSHNEAQSLDPASTTKIMTAVVVLRQAEQQPQLLDEEVLFSTRADQTDGSTADLRAGESVPLRELLYGLLLPSGNDAAVALAEHLGGRLPTATTEDGAANAATNGAGRASDAGGNGDDEVGDGEDDDEDDALARFVALMNQTATELGLQDTNYRNPHGLTTDGHLTSVRDLARLARYAMTMPRFREIVGCRQHGCTVHGQTGYTRNVLWKNTNRLLELEGYSGIKTGTTQAAGACLVSYGSHDGRDLIVVTLGSASTDGRYVDTRNLFRWAWRQLADGAERSSSILLPGPPRDQRVEVVPATEQLHRSMLLIDGHNDLPWRFRELGMPSFQQLDIRQPRPEMHTDIPRLLRGSVGAQFWSVYVPGDTSREGKALLTTLEQIDFVLRMIDHYPDVFRLALTHDEILAARRDGKIACLIGVEGGHCIENSLGVLRQLYERGARYMTLTHTETLDWADSATDEGRHQGLTPFGEEVVREMNRLGMLVDLSHVSIETMKDALRISRSPVIFSHSSARAIADHPRNVPDDVLRRVAENGGVVMVNFYPTFVVPSAARRGVERMDYQRQLKQQGIAADQLAQHMATWDAQHPVDRGSIYDVVDHIEHIIQQAGIDHVGLGSDFDGVDMLPDQLEDVSTYPRITQELLRRGHTPAEIRKVLGENLLRVLKAAER